MIDYKSLHVGKVVADLRMKKKLTQKELAFLAGRNHNAISLMERGNSTPNLDTICNIALALDMLPSELMLEIEKQTKLGEYFPRSEDEDD